MEATAGINKSAIPVSPNTRLEDIHRIFSLQQKNKQNLKNTNAKARQQKLKRLLDVTLEYRNRIEDALYADFRKPKIETAYTEIYNVVAEIKHAIAHLDEWLSPHEADTPLLFFGSSSKIIYEPKGASLIMTPWNYPLMMPVQHLVHPVAAGCTTIIKPSEFTPHTSALVKEMLGKIFGEDEVAVVEGDHTVSTELLKLKFDHIHFTGSPAVGKIVMRAAAEHLTSVTLELGGKSPVIVDDTANLEAAAKKITWGKFLNCGQTCIAPDYVLVDERKKDEFISLLTANIKRVFGEDASQSPDISRIVNGKHFNRLKSLLDDAVQRGAKIEAGGHTNEHDNFIEPTVLSDLPSDSKVMEEEIFGPILPVVGYKTREDALDIINGKEKPLALYIFSSNKGLQDFWLQNTTAGGTCINDNVVHISQINLPFGGVNNSGIGKSGGFYGFKEFCNERGVLKSLHRGSNTGPLWQPYGKLTETITNLMIKYF